MAHRSNSRSDGSEGEDGAAPGRRFRLPHLSTPAARFSSEHRRTPFDQSWSLFREEGSFECLEKRRISRRPIKGHAVPGTLTQTAFSI